MKRKTIYAISTLNYVIMMMIYLSYQQSTTINPQGHCSSYLNRYTSQEQCIYSFVVPKRDGDQCPGLTAKIEDMNEQITELKNWKENVDTNIKLLSNTKESNINLGRCEAQARILMDQNHNLTAANNKLREDKARLEIEVNQMSIQVQEYQSQLVQIQAIHNPLQTNYSVLSNQFNAMKQELTEAQQRFDNLNREIKKLERNKNCSDITKHLPSCAVIKQWGYTTSGEAIIDPDGEGGVDPFLVYCDMDSDPSTGITVINHDNIAKQPVHGCEDPGCFSQPVNYNDVSLLQIDKLKDISLACEQFIRYDCFDSKLLKENTGWWVSRRGEKMRYWGGAIPESNKCACGMDQSCISPTEVCNCDADREEWLFDEGTLRDMQSLPVINLNFGDVSDHAGEKGNVTLGPLKCKWNINISVPSCEVLRQAGVTGSKIFLIDSDGIGGDEAEKTFCNLPDSIQDITFNSSNIAYQTNPTANSNKYTFTSCGKLIGYEGPDEIACNNTYRRTNIKVRVVDGRQIWRVPRTGFYRIRALAPSGYHTDSTKAGRGADVQAEIELLENEIISIFIGQKGNAFAGSGGTFVVKVENIYNNIPLVVAGAGGSSASRGTRPEILDASLNTRAKDASETGQNFGAGGNNGNGGEKGGRLSGVNTSGGGAGFSGDGTKSSDDRFDPLPTEARRINANTAGNLAPGLGGKYTYAAEGSRRELHGGFGGGGSASKNGPGGAGGYSGGGGGPDDGFSGGGGSFVSADAIRQSFNYNQNQEGKAEITLLRPTTSIQNEQI